MAKSFLLCISAVMLLDSLIWYVYMFHTYGSVSFWPWQKMTLKSWIILEKNHPKSQKYRFKKKRNYTIVKNDEEKMEKQL